MYQNYNDIDQFRAEINNVRLTESLKQTYFKPPFYSHLNDLLRYYILYFENLKELKINKPVYDELGSFALAHDPENQHEIDWTFIDDAKEILTAKLKTQLGTEAESQTLQPFINSTIDSMENELIFGMCYQHTTVNPWTSTHQILQNGCLYLISDKEDEIKSIQPKILEGNTDDNKGNLGIIAASKKTLKKNNQNQFSGFIIDNRHSLQTAVYNLLKQIAYGYKQAKTADEIVSILKEAGKPITKQTLKFSVLLPMKREGLIGSNTNGSYFIANIKDLEDSYKHHLQKYNRIHTTLKALEQKANLMGDIDFVERINKQHFKQTPMYN